MFHLICVSLRIDLANRKQKGYCSLPTEAFRCLNGAFMLQPPLNKRTLTLWSTRYPHWPLICLWTADKR